MRDPQCLHRVRAQQRPTEKVGSIFYLVGNGRQYWTLGQGSVAVVTRQLSSECLVNHLPMKPHRQEHSR
jgi:hypothetical protein